MSLGDRIREARKRAKLTLASLGAECGVSPQAVRAWEIGDSEPNINALIRIAAITGTGLEFIISGRDTSTLTVSSPGGRVVPRRSWPDADGDYLVEPPTISVQSNYPCGPRSFSVLIRDHSNDPLICVGDSAIIDPDTRPRPGDLIMAVLPDRSVVLRRFRPRANAVELAPHNSDWPTETVSALDDKTFIGTLTEHTRPRR